MIGRKWAGKRPWFRENIFKGLGGTLNSALMAREVQEDDIFLLNEVPHSKSETKPSPSASLSFPEQLHEN